MVDFVAREYRAVGSFTNGLSTILVPSGERAGTSSSSNVNKNRDERGEMVDESRIEDLVESVSVRNGEGARHSDSKRKSEQRH